MQGSVAVLQQLMKFDLSVVTASRNRTSESTPLHLAAEGGHEDVVKLLLEAGALPQDENKVGRLIRIKMPIKLLSLFFFSGRFHCHSTSGKKWTQCSHRRITGRQS